MVRYLVCLAFLLCLVQRSASQAIVLDAFTVEGDIDVMNPFILDFYDPATWGNNRIRVWADPSYGNDGAMYIGTAQFNPATGITNFVGSFGTDIHLLQPLPLGWNTHYSPFYWKLQVDDDGYRLHFDDFTVTAEINHPSCCNYPTQDTAEGIAKSSVQAAMHRDYAVYFEHMYPCTHPCDTGRARYLYNCDPGETDGRNFPYAYTPGDVMSTTFPAYCQASASALQYCEPGLPPSCDVPYSCRGINWCAGTGYTCKNDLGPEIGYYADGCQPSLYNGDFNSIAVRVKKMKRPEESKLARRSLKSKHTTPGKSKNAARSESESTGSRRRAERHETFLFNHKYLHPQCWALEDIMYDAQNSEYFKTLFYWCYGAHWCYSDSQVCGSEKLPRHVYDSRLNACLGVRGKVWTDVKILEYLTSNSTNSTVDVNVTNGTIFALASPPPEEEVDTGLAFLTRLPLQPAVFGTGFGLQPEGLMNYNQYAYKNFQYLNDWIQDVNYENWNKNRRRTYGIKKTRVDNRDYCNSKKNMCDNNANCFARRTWPGFACRCKEGYLGDGYFCAPEVAKVRVAFNASLQLGINETLRYIAEQLSARTNTPPELLDVSKYANASAFKVYDEDGNFEIVINFPFASAENASLAAAGEITASDGTKIALAPAEGTPPAEGTGESSRRSATNDHFDNEGTVLKNPTNNPAEAFLEKSTPTKAHFSYGV